MSVTYRCPLACPIGKSCFICKTNAKVPANTVFLVKCQHRKHDIAVSADDIHAGMAWGRKQSDINKTE